VLLQRNRLAHGAQLINVEATEEAANGEVPREEEDKEEQVSVAVHNREVVAVNRRNLGVAISHELAAVVAGRLQLRTGTYGST
jgi:hypothetical protein